MILSANSKDRYLYYHKTEKNNGLLEFAIEEWKDSFPKKQQIFSTVLI